MSETTVRLPLAAAYDRWSGFYDAYDNPMVFAAAHAVRDFAHEAAGKDVFEFGCGTGRNLARLRAAGALSLSGCDLSAGMLDKAAERDAGFRLLRHDMTGPVPRPDGSADFVLFCLALEHVGDIAVPLAEAKRLLRPGGRIAIVEIHPFLAEGGVAAHFRDGETVVEMPTFAHTFQDYLNDFSALELRIARCREWRPRDLPPPLPDKVLKRGPDAPLAIEFLLAR